MMMFKFRIINIHTNTELPRHKFLIDGNGKLFMEYKIDGSLVLEEMDQEDFLITMEIEKDAF